MVANRNSCIRLIVLAILCAGVPRTSPGADNSWTNPASGSWEDANNWSLGTAPGSSDDIFLTNAGTFTVNVDDTTADTAPSTLFITNLNIGGTDLPTLLIDFTNTTQTLTVGGLSSGLTALGIAAGRTGAITINDGTFSSDRLAVGDVAGSLGLWNVNGGTSILRSAAFAFPSALSVGLNNNATGIVTMTGGTVQVPNGFAFIGHSGIGTLDLSGGTFQTFSALVGHNAGANGRLNISGGLFVADGSSFSLGGGPGGVGTVTLTGGKLLLTNMAGGAAIGGSGEGSLIMSNGLFEAHVGGSGNALFLASGSGGRGEWKIFGGTAQVFSTTTFSILVGAGANSTGTILVAGGRLDASQAADLTMNTGFGQLILSNGTFDAKTVQLGNNPGSQGQVYIAGGQATLSSSLLIANAAGSTGSVQVSGGTLSVTNITVGGTGAGSMTQSGGQIDANTILIGGSGGGSALMTLEGGILNANGVGLGSGAGQSGTLLVTGGSAIFRESGFANPSALSIGMSGTGTVVMTGGSITATNGYTLVGHSNRGTMIVSNGTYRSRYLYVGINPNSTGDLSIHDGLVTAETMFVGNGSSVSGSVLVSGGALQVTNLTVGGSGAGSITQSGGQVDVNTMLIGSSGGGTGVVTLQDGILNANGVALGSSAGQSGTLLVTGGSATFRESAFANPSALSIGVLGTGTVVMTGGEITATNGYTLIGHANRGTMIVSNGTYRSRFLFVGTNPNSSGDLNVHGGLVSADNNLFVGASDGVTGHVVVASSGVLELKAGTTVGSAATGLGTITNRDGGTIRFTGQDNPTITKNAGGTFVTKDASIEFKDAAAANLGGSISSSITYLGTNTLSLNHASNSPVASYTFETNNLPNFAFLKLSNGGAFLSTTVTVGSGGSISGEGTVSGATTVEDGGTLSPGDTVGQLSFAGDLTLQSNALLRLEIGPSLADSLNVVGSVDISDSILQIIPTASVTSGTFTIIANDLADLVTGEFLGLTNNAFIDASANGFEAYFRIQYNGAGGNDVVLIATIPEPSSLALALLAVAGLRRRRG